MTSFWDLKLVDTPVLTVNLCDFVLGGTDLFHAQTWHNISWYLIFLLNNFKNPSKNDNILGWPWQNTSFFDTWHLNVTLTLLSTAVTLDVSWVIRLATSPVDCKLFKPASTWLSLVPISPGIYKVTHTSPHSVARKYWNLTIKGIWLKYAILDKFTLKSGD